MEKRKVFRKKPMIAALIIFFIMANFFIWTDPFEARAVSDGTLYFNQESFDAYVGSSLSVSAMIDPGSNAVNSVSLIIQYDPLKLSLASATCSDIFSTELLAIEIPSPENGTARIDCAVPPQDNSITISSEVATFNFVASDSAEGSQISFSEDSSAAADGEETDVVNTLTSTLVNIDEDLTSPTITSFIVPSSYKSLNVPITTFIATDNVDVTGYKVTQSSIAPLASDSGWSSTAPSRYSFGVYGSKNLYAWAKDAAGNVSASIMRAIDVKKKSSGSKDSDKKKTPKRYISQSKKKIARGKLLTQRGKKFSKKSPVLLYFSRPGGGYYPPTRIMTDSKGAFILRYQVFKPVGNYSWYAFDVKTGKASKVKYYKVK